jgi:hypothetical protein
MAVDSLCWAARWRILSMMVRVRIPPIVQMGTTQLSSLYPQIIHSVETIGNLEGIGCKVIYDKLEALPYTVFDQIGLLHLIQYEFT